MSRAFKLRPMTATRAFQQDAGVGEFLSAEQTPSLTPEEEVPIHIYALPLHRNGTVVGTLALFHDTSYIDKQLSHTLPDSLLNPLIQTFLIPHIALALLRRQFSNPLI